MSEDVARAMDARAKEKLLSSASKDWNAAEESAKESAQLQIKSINKLREAGIKLREACKHEQISFEFFRVNCEKLPKTMTFKAARFCVSLAASMEAPAKTLDEAKKAASQMFLLLGETESRKRLSEQVSHDFNPWNEFVSCASGMISIFGKLANGEPMEKWGCDKLRTFVSSTAEIAVLHARAKSLLGS